MVKHFSLKNSLFFQDENFPQFVFGVKKTDIYDFVDCWKERKSFDISVYFNPGELETSTDVISLEIGDVLNLRKKIDQDATNTILVQIDSIFFQNNGRSALLCVSQI